MSYLRNSQRITKYYYRLFGYLIKIENYKYFDVWTVGKIRNSFLLDMYENIIIVFYSPQCRQRLYYWFKDLGVVINPWFKIVWRFPFINTILRK